MNTPVIVAGLLGLALILSVAIYTFGRLRIEQERSLQKLIDRGLSGDELLRTAGIPSRASRDRRRGFFLITLGLAWSGFTFFVGGNAWTFGGVPIFIGAALVVFSILDGRFR
jgi:hypothetical protein